MKPIKRKIILSEVEEKSIIITTKKQVNKYNVEAIADDVTNVEVGDVVRLKQKPIPFFENFIAHESQVLLICD